jgi:radical SAM superfamily enzyme YgiQ (UPF0313 family)
MLYDLKDSAWGLKLQQQPWAHRIFDELARGFLLPLLGVPIDLDVRMALGGRRHKPELKTAHPLTPGEFSILLIQPPLSENLRQKRLVPIGLGSLAAYVRTRFQGKPVNIGILDGQSQNLSIVDMLSLIETWKWDMIGVGFMSAQVDIANNLARALRKVSPQACLIAGGNHPTADPESVAAAFDYLVLGEGEHTLGDIIERKMAGQPLEDLSGLAFLKQDGTLQKNPDRPFEKDLDAFPDMAWDLLPMHAYDWPLHIVGGKRLPVMASRGCPYGCTFCSSPVHWRRTVRYRSAERVFQEVAFLQKEYKTDYFHFKDDNFTLNKAFTERFCRLVIEANLGITWICTDRASHLIRHKDILPLMRQAGCIAVEIGIESADPDAYKEYNKEQDVEETAVAIRLQKEAGMTPQYTFLAFAPGETLYTYYHQRKMFDAIHAGAPLPRFFLALPFNLYLGQLATPHPNTGFWRDHEKLGMLLMEDKDFGYHFNINFLPFSLLNDIPHWAVEKLEKRDFIAFAIAIWHALYPVFPGRLPNRRLAARMWEACVGLASFFRWCDGTRTFRKVADRVAYELNWHERKAMRVCALAACLFAQQGMVRSAVHGRGHGIKVERIDIPSFKSRVITFLFWRYAPGSLQELLDS